MRCLQQIHAVVVDLRGDARNVGGPVECLPENRITDRAAGAVRHRADKGRDRHQRRGLAFSPAHMTRGRNSHEQRILTPIALRGHLGHGEIKEIDRINFHGDPGDYRS
jgi:hypothetical protein